MTITLNALTPKVHTIANVDKDMLEMELRAQMLMNAHFKLTLVPPTPFAQTRSVRLRVSVRGVLLEMDKELMDVLTLTSVFWVRTTAMLMLPVWTVLDHINATAEKVMQEMEGNVPTSMNA